jgi:hypothetical protein
MTASTVLERGDLFFFYRPRVDTEEVNELEEVQRFFFILKPEARSRYRQVVVGHKRLPNPEAHERAWAFVAEVADAPDELRDEIEATPYETKTRGARVAPEARAAGEARYAIVDHGGHTHLAYALELPHRSGPVQKDLNIDDQASYIVAVKNPAQPTPPAAGLSPHQRAEFPEQLLELFDGRRFVPVNPPKFLDYEGAELVLIGAANDASAELQIDLDPELERLETADVFEELRLAPRRSATEPLREGRWR